jgi:mono/diheme cytochrome c family protein
MYLQKQIAFYLNGLSHLFTPKLCHGSKGKGDGTKAPGLDTPVPDFTEAAFGNQTDGSLYYKTIFGRDDMPSFEKKIVEEEDRWMIVNYIKKM